MGQTYMVSCPDCGHSFEFSQGCGMFDCGELGRKRHAEKISTGVLGEEPKKILAEHPHARVFYSKELLYCDQCNRYENRSVYRIYEKEQDGVPSALLYVSGYACQKCHKPMGIIGDRESDYCGIPTTLACPRCKKSANVSTVLFFD